MDIFTFVSNVGIPTTILFFVMFRIEKKIDELKEEVIKALLQSKKEN